MRNASKERGGPSTAGPGGKFGGARAPGLTVLLVLLGTCVPAQEATRTRQPLRDGWHVKQLETDKPDIAALTREAASPDGTWLPARMPAQVHDILFKHGRIPDPRISKNAAQSAWVGEKDWVYACKFATPPFGKGRVFLRFEGLDTLATVYLNGTQIGTYNNMYREYEAEVHDHLAEPGQDNILLIVYSSPLRFVNQVERPETHKGVAKHHYLRKCHSDFGSYLGARPHSCKVGVFRDVVLDVPGRAWIDDVWVQSEPAPDFKSAEVRVHVIAGGEKASLQWTLTSPAGPAMTGTAPIAQGAFDFAIDVKEPALWWPRTHGTPNLYRLRVDMRIGDERVDTRDVQFGIRDVRPVLKDPVTGEKRFRFDVNGRPIFMRGACWAPLEGMTHCWNHERAARLLDLAEHGRMNVIRVWGEGHIPPPEFYDECDRRGIFIWQDFMFGYGMHPSGRPGYDANCRAEIEGMIRTLRNHPCILLWVGGNENHMGWDFAGRGKTTVGNEIFHEIMPEACAKLDPQRLFHASSPYGGRVPNWPLEGDWHDYSTLKFVHMASVPLYTSEVGRVSAPSLTSMKRFLSDEELWPEGYDPTIRTPGQAAWPPMWQYRSVGGSWDKVGRLEEFCEPATARDLIRVLGTAHGQYLQRRVERERRGVPGGAPDGSRRCWGNMVWRLNDSWPIIYWSVIDYYLEPKIPFYFLRRAYEPVLVSFEQTDDQIAVWVVNDSPRPVAGTLKVRRLRFDGTVRGELEAKVEVESGEAKRCLETTDLGPVYLRNEFLHASVAGHEATHLLIGERYLHLPRTRLQVRYDTGRVEIATNVFARQVALEIEGVTGAVFEDNFFDLPPGRKRTVGIIDTAGGKRLTIRCLNAETVRLPISNPK